MTTDEQAAQNLVEQAVLSKSFGRVELLAGAAISLDPTLDWDSIIEDWQNYQIATRASERSIK